MDRKQSHIELALAQSQPQSPFDSVALEHCALPGFNFADINLQTHFLGFQLQAPLMIGSMTGGTAEAAAINKHLAEAARECGIALGIGSQRISLTSKSTEGLDQKMRQYAGNTPLFGNVGLANLIQWNEQDCLNKLADRIHADAMIIHLNPMQEIFQDHGDVNWAGSYECLAESIAACDVPVIVKEVGMGLSPDVALRCIAAGAAAIDIAGSGGTSFIAIEGAMSAEASRRQAAHTFSHWGATTVSLLERMQNEQVTVPIIASGGIRNGLDIAKCLALGASMCSVAGIILAAARISTSHCVQVIEQLKFELAIACWGTGCPSVNKLSPKLIVR